jgi:hypothetical protein
MLVPQDDALLLSVVNTYLRDKYDSLKSLCEEEDWDEQVILTRLSAFGYVYEPTRRAFVAE